jgi:phosphatidylglycerol:prolipoprotein diacylglycerol transferase
MLGQIIGRWGNFVNAEAFGTATDLPWRMSILGVGAVHPTFLYESLWNLLGFIVLSLIYKYKKFDGLIFLIYVSWYGLGRMLIEGLRTDSLMLILPGIGIDLRISQVIGGLSLFAGLIIIILFAGKAKIKALENDASYQGVYSSAIAKITEKPEEPVITEESEAPAEEPDTADDNAEI